MKTFTPKLIIVKPPIYVLADSIFEKFGLCFTRALGLNSIYYKDNFHEVLGHWKVKNEYLIYIDCKKVENWNLLTKVAAALVQECEINVELQPLFDNK